MENFIADLLTWGLMVIVLPLICIIIMAIAGLFVVGDRENRRVR